MRNLRNIRFSQSSFDDGQPLAATCWDSATDSAICAFGPTEENAVIKLTRRAQHEDVVDSCDFSVIASWDAPCPNPDLACDRILSMLYSPARSTVCLVLEGGDIIIVREVPQPEEDPIEIVGSIDAGISAAAWSPDEELLAIVTKQNTLLYLTKGFDSVAEFNFSSDDLQMSRHVSVGWGKKETQFHGKRAKALRDPTMPEKVDEGKLSDFDNSKTTLSWRGDGAYLAVNSIETGIRRVIRVFTREATLDSVSEPVNGLEGALSWRPAGNLIAGIQRLDSRIDVVFFERNGLRHGQFTLRLTQEERSTWAKNIDLYWNPDSTVLAVAFEDRLQLWTMGNYHYYLKQEILYSDSKSLRSSLVSFTWNPESSMRFLIGSEVFLLDVDLVFDVSKSSTIPSYDFGGVAVVDGRLLKLSPLKIAAIPPPMALCEISLESNIVDVAFSMSGDKIAILAADGLSIYTWDLNSTSGPEPQFQTFYPLDTQRSRQVAFLNEDEVYILSQTYFGGEKIERINLQTEVTDIIFVPKETDHISAIFSDFEQKELWVSQITRKQRARSYLYLSVVDSGAASIVPWHDSPSNDTSWASAVELHTGAHILFSLSRSGSLYANRRFLAKNVTSFLLTPAHIIYTTSLHLLKFVHLTDNVEGLEIPGDTPEEDERCRSIERGAKLVTAMPSKFALTLQMPRGNIETIYPRAFVLAGIRQYIEQKKYKSAYLVCRSQMVDMNILHDYLPSQFLDNIPLFIDQVKRVDFIDEFLSRLKDEDVTKTLYKDTLKMTQPYELVEAQTSPSNDSLFGITAKGNQNKVNKICDAFISVLKTRINTNLQNLVTCHVCKSPPDLDAGLTLVAGIRDHRLIIGADIIATTERSAEQAEEAVEHMCFLTDAHQLFNNALGLYDLELTLMVAQQAQRDPREYLPFLQKLQGLEEIRRHYEIDNHLGRFSKALRSLHALNSHDDLKLYTIKHSLYKDALELYKYQPDFLRDMTQLYADHLYDQSKYKDAAIAYESLDIYESAYQSYMLAHMWQESLYCAALVPLSEAKMKELAISLATTLTDENKDYVSAAYIYEDHLKDIPSAARLFCRGSQFSKACRLLLLHGHKDLIPDIVDSALAESMGSMTELLADCRNQLLAQVPRVRELRVKRAADPLGFYGGDPVGGGEGADIPDNVSLAPTDATTAAGRSMFTRYTGGTSTSKASTSRNRRREERKRARGKKGTVYEEEYLVNSIRRLIERVNGAVEEVEVLAQGMLRRGMRERATVIGKNLDEVLEMCRSCVDEVFEAPTDTSEPTALEQQKAENEIPPTAGERVYMASMDELISGKGREPPIVKSYDKLALQGV
ncbi:hypothetical protein FQN57_005812 [Myotisia sp. PD_48]|nr:hypothetical protein FQN57_005812 [Myotisia sp. PD_48]